MEQYVQSHENKREFPDVQEETILIEIKKGAWGAGSCQTVGGFLSQGKNCRLCPSVDNRKSLKGIK